MKNTALKIKSKIQPYNWVTTHRLKLVLMLLFSLSFANAYPAKANNKTEKASESIRTVSVPIFSTETKKDFGDVIEDLLVSIGEHNFRLNQHARIGRAISEREEIPFPAITVLHFCNLDYAKQLLEIAPDYLLNMPCRVSVRQKKDKTVLIEVWLLPEDDKRTTLFAKKINAILKEIVLYGAS